MASKLSNCTRTHCIKWSKFADNPSWQLDDFSLSLSGNVAVSGRNFSTFLTCLEVYQKNSDSRDKLVLCYSREFGKSETCERLVSFLEPESEEIVTCCGYRIEVIALKCDQHLCRVLKGEIACLSAQDTNIFVGFKEPKIIMYSRKLDTIKSISVKRIQENYSPTDMAIAADRLYISTLNNSVIALGKENETIGTVFTSTTGQALIARSVTASAELDLVAVLWGNNKIGVCHPSEQTALLTINCEENISRIRISDKGKLTTGNWKTGEMKHYEMFELFTYHSLKQRLASQFKIHDCKRLANFFDFPNDWAGAIIDTLPAKLLLALEEKSVIQPSNIDRLTEALKELNISSYHLLDLFKKTRRPSTLYGKFLATLSAHLTTSLTKDLCCYFNIPDDKESSITSSQNPGLSLLLTLDEMEVIKPSDVVTLELPFSQLQLVQAKAKVKEYQVHVRKENAWSQGMLNQTIEDKVEIFVQCLQNKIKGWYETWTPVPWKKSCRWRSSDLFVRSVLILTDSKAKPNPTSVDPQCKLEYQDVLTNHRLKFENRLILEGEPGSGKTMLSSQLAYDWAQGKFKDTQILVFLPLKFVEGKKLVSAMRNFYVSEKIPLSEEDIEAVLNNDDLSTVILLDGLEEYNSPVTKAKGKPSEIHKIMAKRNYPGCKVVLTCRSDCALDLPACPVLKLETFGEGERNTYIERVFAENMGKGLECKRVIENTPFMMELFSVPLFFALGVHNIERMAKLHKDQLDRVTPFMDGMVQTICPPIYDKDIIHTVKLEEYKPRRFTVEELAFSCLCKGFQQLSWSKDFMVTNVDNIKDWIDSGILVVEEEIANVAKDEPRETVKEAEKDKVPSTSCVLKEGKEYGTASKKTMFYSESYLEQDSDKDSQSKESKQTSSALTAQIVALRITFLHKVFQEWFAAKYLSSVIWFEKKSSFSEHLASINPVDLHYILRFTCYLCPPSCHIILNHLLSNYRSSEGIIPKHIMNCICLCYREYDGYMGDDIKMAVSEICKETITIQSTDSRLLQQSKIAMLKFASQSGIPIMKVQLLDVVATVGEELLTFNSGVTLDVLHTLRVIEISRWDQKLKEEDYSNLVNLIAMSQSTKSAYLSFPSQPPILLQHTLDKIAIKDIAVHWQIGQLVQTLDPSKKMWTFNLRKHQMTLKSPVQVGPDFSIEQSRKPSTSASLPGISGIPTSTQTKQKQETSKQHGTDTSQFTSEIPIFKKRRKMDSTEEEESFVESFQQGESQGIHQQPVLEIKTVITKDGTTVQIPGTQVVLMIPSGALPKDMNECAIRMRIVPRSVFKDPVKNFSSYSSEVVEILPNNLKLQCAVQLTLPHCLLLQEGAKHKAHIFMSHYERGGTPQWKEHTYLKYCVEKTTCTVWLKSFCWVTIKVNDKTVVAKKLILFTCREKYSQNKDFSSLWAGYYYDDGNDGKFLQMNQTMECRLKVPFNFMKEGAHPLQLLLKNHSLAHWRLCEPPKYEEMISFDSVVETHELTYRFVFQKTVSDAMDLMCSWNVSQKQGQSPVWLTISMGAVGNVRSNQSERKHTISKEQMLHCFTFFKRSCARSWRDVGRYLKISEDELDRFHGENKEDLGECIYKMLVYWHQQNGSEAAPEELVKVLEKLERKDLAERLTKTLEKPL